jgi:prepilin-type processing-associated H-X9-DG protein
VKRIDCVNNVKQLGLSFRIWAGDNSDKYPMQLSVTNGGTMEHLASGVAWPHFQVLSNELNTPKILVCPEDKPRVKVLEKLQTEPEESRSRAISFQNNCPLSYFVGVDAEESKPTMLLTGDDNLAIGGKPVASGLLSLWTNSAVGWNKPRHPNGGNTCFADGSVQQISSPQLREALVNTGVATNRLAMP